MSIKLYPIKKRKMKNVKRDFLRTQSANPAGTVC